MNPRHAVTLAALLLASCATPQPHGRGPHGHGGFAGGPGPEGGERGPRLFISPSGEPFRAAPGGPPPLVAWFEKADANHDGAISLDEFRVDADAFFSRIDANGDGAIDMDEVAVYEKTVVPELIGQGRGERFGGGEGPGGPGGGMRGGMRRGGGRGRGGPPGGGGWGEGGADLDAMTFGAGRYSLINEAEPIRAADANYDMKVDRAEWRAASDRRFKQLDKDGDGVLHLAELRRTPDIGGDGGGQQRRRRGGEE